MSTVQDIFLQFYEGYVSKYGLDYDLEKVANAIIQCKSGELGYNVCYCADCESTHTHYNSCRNRNCPGCQEIPKEVWVDARKAEVLEGVSYYHAVFTIPEELNALVFANKREMYSLLHKCVSQTLLELSADRKYFGEKPGIIQVLHTWGSKMNYHPHIHAVIMGCGLTDTNQVAVRSKFFIPVEVLSHKFRGKFIALLKELHKDGKLHFSSSVSGLADPAGWNNFTRSLYAKDWIPFIKETFKDSGNAIDYLGRYTHRIAISNSRIVEVTDTTVTFSYKDYRDGNTKELTLDGVEFVRRFLMHVLPKGFVKIRNYGAFNNRMKKKTLKTLRGKMKLLEFKAELAGLNSSEILKKLYGVDVSRCPDCGSIYYYTIQKRYPMRC